MAEMLEELAARLSRRGALEVDRTGDQVRIAPRRAFGNRGVLRLLRPAAQGRVRLVHGVPRISVSPDGWAWLIWVVMAGASAVEVLMDRAVYPRDYPAWAPFAGLAAYSLLMAIAVVGLSSAIRRAIGR